MYPGAEETILAIATPPGHAALGIVRISGREAFPLTAALCENPPPPVRGVHHIALTGLAATALPALVILLPGPGSFTGEDTAEIVAAGNPLLLDRVIELLLQHAESFRIAARRARAGEFSARAYLNGRLTAEETHRIPQLLSAERIDDVRALQSQRADDRTAAATDWRDRLADLLALVEAGIDFTDEEDVVAISAGRLAEVLNELATSMSEALHRGRPREADSMLFRVIFVGAPNAGKSTLFNALLGRPRVVTSPVAGATQDVIEEPANLGDAAQPFPVLLVDTAGAEPSASTPLELPTDIHRARQEAIERADVALLCRAPGHPRVPSPRPDIPVIALRTMLDLDVASTIDEPHDELPVSAHTGAGLEALRARLRRALEETATSSGARASAHRSADHAHLEAARDLLVESREACRQMPAEQGPSDPELMAHTLRRALDHLGAVAGHASPDDVLGRIFSTFCIGK